MSRLSGLVVMSCSVVRVVDGDTVIVQPVPPAIPVRLLDCWAPETRSRSATEKRAGIESASHLRRLLPVGSACLVEFVTSDSLDERLSFGRLLARIRTSEGVDVSAAQVAAGYATVERSSKRGPG